MRNGKNHGTSGAIFSVIVFALVGCGGLEDESTNFDPGKAEKVRKVLYSSEFPTEITELDDSMDVAVWVSSLERHRNFFEPWFGYLELGITVIDENWRSTYKTRFEGLVFTSHQEDHHPRISKGDLLKNGMEVMVAIMNPDGNPVFEDHCYISVEEEKTVHYSCDPGVKEIVLEFAPVPVSGQ